MLCLLCRLCKVMLHLCCSFGSWASSRVVFDKVQSCCKCLLLDNIEVAISSIRTGLDCDMSVLRLPWKLQKHIPAAPNGTACTPLASAHRTPSDL